jgi:RNA 3'-terminal phosphate cyclase (ATP)
MALAHGKSVLRTGPLTLHTRTAIHWATHVGGAKFTVTETPAGTTIECEGIGYVSRFKR